MALNEAEQAQAEALHRAHRRQADATLSDANLSAQGRRARLAQNYLAHQGQLDQLFAQADQRAQADGQAAARRVFGVPAGADGSMILAHRDALDRTADIGPGEAGRLLAQAHANGDETLARAIGQRAFEQAGPQDLGGHWATVLEQFAQSSPARQRAIGELAGQRADATEVAARMRDNMLRHISKPSEIAAGDVHQIAAQADGTT
jgi:hypothetical protein